MIQLTFLGNSFVAHRKVNRFFRNFSQHWYQSQCYDLCLVFLSSFCLLFNKEFISKAISKSTACLMHWNCGIDSQHEPDTKDRSRRCRRPFSLASSQNILSMKFDFNHIAWLISSRQDEWWVAQLRRTPHASPRMARSYLSLTTRWHCPSAYMACASLAGNGQCMCGTHTGSN